MDRLVGLMCYFFDMKIISLLEKKRIHPDFSDPEVNQDDIYKFDPPNLPGLSESDSDEQGWYFFCEPYYKYAKSERVNRQTPGGYWTITGGGSDLRNKRGQVIGSKKILVFYLGDSSNGVKTDWVMHEFYVKDKNDPRYKKDFVLCFIERKPKKSTNRKKKSNKSALSTPDDGQPRNSLSSVSVCQVAESPYIEVKSKKRKSNQSTNPIKKSNKSAFSTPDDGQPRNSLSSVSISQVAESPYIEVESQQPSSSHRLSYDSGGNITEISFSGVEPQPLQTANLVRDPGSLFRESINSLVESQPLLDNNFVPDQMNLFAEMQVDPQLLAELYSTNSSCWLNQSPLPAPQLPTNPDQYQGFNSSTYSTGFWEDCNMQDFQFDGDFGDAISLWDLEN
ncbi:NAC domain-containing protein 2-like isoform X1 [Mangifera indica]|uniref:NAC domain-containing protein 2-like isoform X1 n=1 Tax=Mangifera indica TaxID=29780 RepID=UPI001CFC2384|nr:NAC domain-containing protein 2-like isoform X1 [Mangifera indica]